MKNDAGKYDSYSDGGLPNGPYQEPVKGASAGNALSELAEAKALADSEGSRAVEYLRRARKAEVELAAARATIALAQSTPHVPAGEPSDAEIDGYFDKWTANRLGAPYIKVSRERFQELFRAIRAIRATPRAPEPAAPVAQETKP